MRTRSQKGWMFALPLMFLGGVALHTAPAYAHFAQDTTEYTLKRTYTPKTTDHYRVKLALTVNSPQFSGDLDAEMRFKEVAGEVKEGEFKVNTEFVSGVAKLMGGEFPLPEDQLPPTAVRTIKEGAVTKREFINPNKKDEGIAGLLNIADAIMPTKAVKAGDKWDVEFTDPSNKDAKFKIGEASLTGKEKLKDYDTVKIHWKVTIAGKKDGKENKMEFEGDTNIDIKSGRAIQTKVKAQANVQEGLKIRSLQIDMLTAKEVEELDKK